MPEGIFRERQGDATLICLKFRKHNFLVPEEFYRECGYSPPVEELPWTVGTAN
jgi:hypothetical protein